MKFIYLYARCVWGIWHVSRIDDSDKHHNVFPKGIKSLIQLTSAIHCRNPLIHAENNKHTWNKTQALHHSWRKILTVPRNRANRAKLISNLSSSLCRNSLNKLCKVKLCSDEASLSYPPPYLLQCPLHVCL